MIVRALTARNGWKCKFRHPVIHQQISRGLGNNEAFAVACCAALTICCNDPALCQSDIVTIDPLRLREVGYGPAVRKALEIFYGDSAKPRIADLFKDDDAGLSQADIGEVTKRMQGAKILDLRAIEALPDATFPTSEDRLETIWHSLTEGQIAAMLEKFMPAKVREQRNEIERLQTQWASVQPDLIELAELRLEVKKLRREANAHCKTTIGAAVKRWLIDFAKGRSARHVRDGLRWIAPAAQEQTPASFVDSLPHGAAFMLAELRRSHVSAWVRSFGDIDPKTALKRRNYVTAFMKFAAIEYDITDPFTVLPTIQGVSDHKRVEAIQDFADFKLLIDSLDLYWSCLVAVCVLAGPREGELFRLRIDDIEGHMLHVPSTKTAEKFRYVPIEAKTLAPKLALHVAQRQKQQREAIAEPLKTDLLFPNLLEPGPVKPKVFTGQWSGAKAFLTAFGRELEAAKLKVAKSKRALPVWSFTPAIYRHTFASALARTGRSAIQIAQLMGNSDEVAMRHYIDQFSHCEPWPVEWPNKREVST